jgi:hypothetical protein
MLTFLSWRLQPLNWCPCAIALAHDVASTMSFSHFCVGSGRKRSTSQGQKGRVHW